MSEKTTNSDENDNDNDNNNKSYHEQKCSMTECERICCCDILFSEQIEMIVHSIIFNSTFSNFPLLVLLLSLRLCSFSTTNILAANAFIPLTKYPHFIQYSSFHALNFIIWLMWKSLLSGQIMRSVQSRVWVYLSPPLRRKHENWSCKWSVRSYSTSGETAFEWNVLRCVVVVKA